MESAPQTISQIEGVAAQDESLISEFLDPYYDPWKVDGAEHRDGPCLGPNDLDNGGLAASTFSYLGKSLLEVDGAGRGYIVDYTSYNSNTPLSMSTMDQGAAWTASSFDREAESGVRQTEELQRSAGNYPSPDPSNHGDEHRDGEVHVEAVGYFAEQSPEEQHMHADYPSPQSPTDNCPSAVSQTVSLDAILPRSLAESPNPRTSPDASLASPMHPTIARTPSPSRSARSHSATPSEEAQYTRQEPDEASRQIIESFLGTTQNPTGNRRAFLCTFPGCNHTFARKFNCLGHIATHLDLRNFECSVPCSHGTPCGAKFARMHDLRRHQNVHEGIRAAGYCKCENCVEDRGGKGKGKGKGTGGGATRSQRKSKNAKHDPLGVQPATVVMVADQQ